MPNPTGRGTVGLLWSCIITFALCVWTAVHPDVIWARYPSSQLGYKLWWTLWAAFAPEFTVAYAMFQRKQASDILKIWRQSWADEVGEEVDEHSLSRAELGAVNQGRAALSKRDWLGEPGAFFVVMSGFVIVDGDGVKPGYEAPIVAVTAPGFTALLQLGIIQELVRENKLRREHFDSRNIGDRSKASIVAKAIVGAQLLWTVIQCIGRKASNLPVTLLEVHVLIHIAYTILAYFFWWHKPLDVAEPIAIPLDSRHRAKLSQAEPAFFASIEDGITLQNRDSLFVKSRTVFPGPLSPVSMISYDLASALDHDTRLWSTIMAIINGALHCVAWLSHFPSPAEKWLWRVSSLGIAGLNIILYAALMPRSWGVRGDALMLLVATRLVAIPNCSPWRALRESLTVVLPQFNRGSTERHPSSIGYPGVVRAILWLLYLTLYLSCILFVTIESVISIRSLPAGSYQSVTWSNYFPHF